MDLEDIKQILTLVREHELAEFELERDGLKLRVRKAGPAVSFAPPVVHAHAAPAHIAPVAPALSSAPPPAEAPADELDLGIIKSPIVGTFYRAAEPGAAPFVDVGTVVTKGQVLCIIEAMKLMNEIESDVEGVLMKVYPSNGQPIEYGEKLFAVKLQ